MPKIPIFDFPQDPIITFSNNSPCSMFSNKAQNFQILKLLPTIPYDQPPYNYTKLMFHEFCKAKSLEDFKKNLG